MVSAPNPRPDRRIVAAGCTIRYGSARRGRLQIASGASVSRGTRRVTTHARFFDYDFMEDAVDRLAGLPNDRVPKWGRMHASELVPHLTHVLQYSMGRLGSLPFVGNAVTANVEGPLVLAGWIPLRRNLDLPQPCGGITSDGAALETLHAVMDDYMYAAQTGELVPARHARYGDIGIDGWGRLHVMHIEHHLRQFDL